MDKRTDPIGIGDLFADIPELFLPLFDGAEYPWEILPRISRHVLPPAGSMAIPCSVPAYLSAEM